MNVFSWIRQLFGKKTPQGPKELIEIYVGNLSYDMKAELTLEEIAEKFGIDVKQLKIKK